MKKRGFTLVELLAVIAILAILVIMALPAVLRMFEKARVDSFTNEVNTIIRTARQQYLLDGGISQTWTNVDGSSNKLPLTGNSKLKYYVSIDGNGKITELKATNGNYKYESSGIVDEVHSTEVEVAESNYELSGTQTPSYVYSIKPDPGQNIGDTITVNNTDTFDNYNDAVTAFGYPHFTAHVVNGSNEITESYAGFVKDGTVYYLKGGDNGLAYNSNKQVLDTAFGSSNCTLGMEGTNSEYYSCSASGLVAIVRVIGTVDACSNNEAMCSVYGDRKSYCYIHYDTL